MNTCCVAGWGSASSAGFSKLCPRVIPTCVQSSALLWPLPDSSSMLFSPPLPILSSRSSPLFSSRSFLSPSSILSFFLSSALIDSQTALSCLLFPLHLSSSSSSSSSPHVAAQLCGVYPCITVTTLPAPAVKLFLGELTCEWRALSRRKEESAETVMEKQVPPLVTAGSDQILCFVNIQHAEE